VTILQAARSAVRLRNVRLAVKPTHPSVQLVPGCYFSGVNRPVCEVDHPPPSNAEVKNVWSYTSAHLTCLRGMQRYFTFIYSYVILSSRRLSVICARRIHEAHFTHLPERSYFIVQLCVLHTPYTTEQGALEASRFSASQEIQLCVQLSRLQLYQESFQNFYCFQNCSNCVAVKKTSQTVMASIYL